MGKIIKISSLLFCFLAIMTALKAQIVPKDTITTTICMGEFYLENGFAIIGQEAGYHTYTEHFTATDGSDSIVLLQVTVLDKKTVSLGKDRFVCQNKDFPVTLDAGTGFLTYVWNTGEISQDIQVTKPGEYTIVATYGVNCSTTSTVKVESHEVKVDLAMDPVDFCETNSTTITATAQGDNLSYKWSNGCTTAENSVTQYGDYTVVVSNDHCSAKKTLKISECPFNLYFPNAFTPFYQDGINDYFELIGNKDAIQSFVVVICDRWGKQVFYSTDVNFKWDGKVDDEYLIDNVFRYAVKVQTYQGKKYVYKGSVTVL